MAVKLMVAGVVYGLAVTWWWALLGLSYQAGFAHGMTSIAMLISGFMWYLATDGGA